MYRLLGALGRIQNKSPFHHPRPTKQASTCYFFVSCLHVAMTVSMPSAARHVAYWPSDNKPIVVSLASYAYDSAQA